MNCFSGALSICNSPFSKIGDSTVIILYPFIFKYLYVTFGTVKFIYSYLKDGKHSHIILRAIFLYTYLYSINKLILNFKFFVDTQIQPLKTFYRFILYENSIDHSFEGCYSMAASVLRFTFYGRIRPVFYTVLAI